MAAEARSKADRIDAMASNWEAGEAGERRVAEALRPLEGAHCHVLHELRPRTWCLIFARYGVAA
jgi:hypothetical protein